MLSEIERGHAFIRDVATINGHSVVEQAGAKAVCTSCQKTMYSLLIVWPGCLYMCGEKLHGNRMSDFTEYLQQNFYKGFH